MLIDITAAQARELLSGSEHIRKKTLTLLPAIMAAVANEFAQDLKGNRALMFSIVLGRTLAVGARAIRLSIPDLVRGIPTAKVPSKPCGLGINTVRTALHELVSLDFLHSYRTLILGSNIENDSRIFVVNDKKFGLDLGLDNLISGEIGPLDSKDQEGGTPKSWRGHNDIYIRDYVSSENSLKEQVLSFPSPSAPGAKLEVRPMPIVGKRFKVVGAPAGPSAATQAVASIVTAASDARASRVEAAKAKAPHEVTRQEMQAMLDKHAMAVGVGYRLMATTREYGFLKKRLKENPPPNLDDFLRYTLTYWSTLARQNSTAVRKRIGQTPVAEKPLDGAPHFNTLTYRYPYFLKCYVTHLAGKGNSKDGEHDEVRALKEKLQAARDENRSLQRMVAISRSPRPAAPAPGPAIMPVAATRRAPVDLNEEVVFPEWDSSKVVSPIIRRRAQ